MIESFSFSDLSRRVANLIRLGKIAEVKDAQVKVSIGKVITNWLPILSMAGDTSCWIPISVGEQVMVISPYGEMSQAVVLRSINYNSFSAPENKEEISLTSKNNVKTIGTEQLFVSFDNGIELKVGDVSISLSNGEIVLISRDASIKISNSGIQLSCGASTIDIDSSRIALNSGSISTVPPLCKCLGGL